MKRKVMTRAWEIAREGQAKFGGKAKEYFAVSLQMAWAEATKPEEKRELSLYERVLEALPDTDRELVFQCEAYGKVSVSFKGSTVGRIKNNCFDFVVKNHGLSEKHVLQSVERFLSTYDVHDVQTAEADDMAKADELGITYNSFLEKKKFAILNFSHETPEKLYRYIQNSVRQDRTRRSHAQARRNVYDNF